MAMKLLQMFSVPRLTPKRVWFAFGVAAITDAIQMGLGPVGSLFIDQGLDVIAMVLISAAVGFHLLLLPTFVLELLPLANMLPTWTGCTAAVVMMRKKAEEQAAPPPIDVPAEVTRVPHQPPPESVRRDSSP